MKSELIVDVKSSEVQIALLEDSRLVSLQKEARNIAYAVGDIYLAKVKKLMPGLNAAFVNVGYEKDAFLHYLDLGSHFASYDEFVQQTLDKPKNPPVLSKLKLKPEISKNGSIADVLEQGRQLSANRKRTYFFEGSPPYDRIIIYGEVHGAYSFLRQNFNFAENHEHRGKVAPAPTRGKHKA